MYRTCWLVVQLLVIQGILVDMMISCQKMLDHCQFPPSNFSGVGIVRADFPSCSAERCYMSLQLSGTKSVMEIYQVADFSDGLVD